MAEPLHLAGPVQRDTFAVRAEYVAEMARAAICKFPDSEAKRALLWAPEFVVAREK